MSHHRIVFLGPPGVRQGYGGDGVECGAGRTACVDRPDVSGGDPQGRADWRRGEAVH